MGSKKKLLTSVAALTTTAALLLGGTFAWQSISQTALNESTDTINPGGRLHNDIASAGSMETLNYIYVENFTDEGGEDIYARIRLEEYMELVMNYGVEDVEVVKNVAGVKTPKPGSTYDADDATRRNEFDYTYELHLFGDDVENATDDYWTWILGAEERNPTRGSYMPTFNKNKDSLAADQNGSYTMAIGGITDRDSNYNMDETTGGFAYYFDKAEDVTTYGYGTHTKTAYAIYDNDGNQVDELAGLSDADLKDIIANGDDSTELPDDYDNAIHLEEETHTAKRIGNTNGTISMAEWLALLEEDGNEYDADVHGGYWVYDTDGWVYWSSPIKSGETTGPLLESFILNHEMNDTWYYAINVEAQFITADDLGAADGTGFYDTNGWYNPDGLSEAKANAFAGMGKAPSDNALTLLELIGVEVPSPNHEVTLSTGETSATAVVSVAAGDTVTLKYADGTHPVLEDGSAVDFAGSTTTPEEYTDYTYDEDGVLTLMGDTLSPGMGFRMYLSEEDPPAVLVIYEDDGKITFTEDYYDCTTAAIDEGVTVETTGGTAPDSITVKNESESSTYEAGADSAYEYADGTLTIHGEGLKGETLTIICGDMKALLYVQDD